MCEWTLKLVLVTTCMHLNEGWQSLHSPDETFHPPDRPDCDYSPCGVRYSQEFLQDSEVSPEEHKRFDLRNINRGLT